MKRVLLLLMAGFVVVTIHAQSTVTTKQYTVSGGLLGALNFSEFRIPDVDTVDYDTQTGWSFGGWLNVPISNGLSFEPQVMYSRYEYHTNNTTADLLLRSGKISYISLPLLLKLHAGDKFAFTLGPQFDFMTSVDYTDNDDNNPGRMDDFHNTSISLSGGLEILPHGRITLFGRYIHGFTNLDDRANHNSQIEYKNQNIQAGLKLRLFGGRTEPVLKATDVIPDSDGDGINDQLDKCPNTPGLAKYDGCPIPDSDNDGINDELDKCPNQAGVAKYDGCPVPDTDGDGINDEMDKCPTQAGTAEREGCPAKDSDNDGITDENDKCPDIAGTAANNGCPDIPANVTKTLSTTGTGITFTNRTSSTLTTRSNSSLDNIVRLMNENPGMKIRVEAHTDNVGDDDDNENLSSARAKAVQAYLVSKGISDDRIKTEGFGEEMPIADNNTSAGRARNNRIEIKIDY